MATGGTDHFAGKDRAAGIRIEPSLADAPDLNVGNHSAVDPKEQGAEGRLELGWLGDASPSAQVQPIEEVAPLVTEVELVWWTQTTEKLPLLGAHQRGARLLLALAKS